MELSTPDSLTYEVELPSGRQRLAEAALYVSGKCQEMERFGLVKLNKILWRADFTSYRERGVPVTGRAYQRLRNGPAPVEMPVVLNQLVGGGYARFERRPIRQYEEVRLVPEGQPNLNIFSRDDVDYFDEAISHYRRMSATTASDKSHGVAWKSRSDGDPMPYELALLCDEPLPKSFIKRLSEIASIKGWVSA